MVVEWIWPRRSNPKISFPSFFAFRRGVKGEPEENGRKFLGLPRASPRARPRRMSAQSGRTLQFRAATHG
ncbi:MAG: hypothetical protein A2719_04065 [Candidatus Ryanbacteria bacterium RIFCSPHIGHO2_01_FULL_45_22]|uniref:Uncharacterized protein n=1 Tax=Candidatus Ryanbacteria bacterium RIFCSPHIGHO2_01_FULL_45_22 TaxID=1802114 RepID=A0A1G2G3G4_9BACT|nr:MAG: hypothetical protein A2719_04065 [Candidatus Ryanbacteria bacterium RIFCSPHIGHO2_01_FULL_45_22]